MLQPHLQPPKEGQTGTTKEKIAKKKTLSPTDAARPQKGRIKDSPAQNVQTGRQA